MTVRGSQIKTVKSALERFASILNEGTRLTFLDRSYDNNDVLKYQGGFHFRWLEHSVTEIEKVLKISTI